MERKTRFQQTSAHTEWFQWCRSLLDLYQTDKYFVVDDIEKGSLLQMRRWILGHNFDGTDQILRNLLLDALLSADNKSIGSEVYVPWFLYNDGDFTAQRHSSQIYLEATLSKTKSEVAKSLFKNLFDSIGPLTKIVPKPSYDRDIILKYRNAFSFPLPLDPQFHRIIGHTVQIEQTNPIVIMIEGAPETVSEINSLLQWNHENQRPVLLIARSFPEEVSATLATNWLRGSLSVVPIPYGNTIESINLAADMCAISGGELISAHFGDVIAACILNEDKWGSVDRLEWSDGKLSLYANKEVSGHVNNLITKMASIEEEEIQKIYQDRILSLSNDALEVWIPKENIFLLKELDGLLKHYNGFVISGLVETPIGPLPKCFADTAKQAAQSLRSEILNIGGFLVGVDDEVDVGR